MSFVSSPVGLVLVDSRVNSGIIKLPATSSLEGRNIIFKDAFGKFSQKTLTLSTVGIDIFEDSSVMKIINQNRGSASLIAQNGSWYQIDGTKSSEQYINSLNISSINDFLPEYISKKNLQSTTTGLGLLTYISTVGITDLQLASTVEGLGNTYLSSYSTIISPDNLQSTIEGLNLNYVSSPIIVTSPSDNFMVIGGQGTNVIGYSYDGIIWINSTSPFTTSCLAIAWNGSLWVAGGEGTYTITYSYNGINWINSTSGSSFLTTSCRSVAWNGSLWVAGGEGTNIIGYSYDGINWTSSISSFSVCLAIAWNGSLWVAGGTGTYTITYSYDGIIWINSTSPFTTSCHAIAWNGSLWVAGGEGSSQIAYSSNGINWTNSASGGGLLTSTCLSVAWNGSLWVAGGSGTQVLIYSSNGINWLASTNGNSLFTLVYSISWNGSLWLAGGSGTYTIAYSYDGINWLASNSLFTVKGNAAASRTVLPYVGYSPVKNKTILASTIIGLGSLRYVSSIGISELQLSSTIQGIGNKYLSSYSTIISPDNLQSTILELNLNYVSSPIIVTSPSDNFMVIGGQGTNVIGYSYDGITWTNSTNGNDLFSTVNAIAWNGSLWIAGGSGACTIAYSSDGINWIDSGTSIFTIVYTIAWNGSLWQASGVAVSEYTHIAYSYDGINWTISNSPFSACYTIAWNGSTWLAGGNFVNYKLIEYSSDGINWTQIMSGVNTPAYTTFAWNGSLWVAGSLYLAGNIITYSSDGKTWTASISGSSLLSTSCRSVAWNGSLWVAGGEGTEVLAYSSNGINWLASTNGNSLFTLVYSISWNGSIWLAGGEGTYTMAYSYDGINWLASNSLFTVKGNAAASRTVLPYVGYSPLKNKTILASTIVGLGSLRYVSSIGISELQLGSTIQRIGNKYLSSYSTIVFEDNLQSTIIEGLNYISTFIPFINPTENFMVGVGYGNTTNIIYSYDGLIWHPSPIAKTLVTTFITGGLVYNGSLWLAIAQNSDDINFPIVYSSDGINWTGSSGINTAFGGSGNQVHAIAWNGLLWVLGGFGDAVPHYTHAYSYDGLIWNPCPKITYIAAGMSLACNNSIWVCGCQGGVPYATLAYSKNGIDWITNGFSIFTVYCYGVAWNGAMFVGVGSGEGGYAIAYSYDGITWTGSVLVTAGLFTTGYAVAWNGSLWVAAGQVTNSLAYSYDGINWLPSANGNSIFAEAYCTSIAWNGSLWIAGGRQGYGNASSVGYSYNGIYWFNSSSGTDILTGYNNAGLWAVASRRVLPFVGYKPPTNRRFINTLNYPYTLI